MSSHPVQLAAVARRNALAQSPPEGELSTSLSTKGSKLPKLWPDQKILFQTIGEGDNTILLNPDAVVAEEGEALGLGIYDELVDNDPQLEGLLQTRVQAAIGLQWEIQPADRSPQSEADAELVRQVLWSIEDFEEARRGALYGKLLKGFSVVELVWGGRDGLSTILRLKDHDQRNWLFDTAWRPRLIVDWGDLTKSALVDPRRVVVMRHKPSAWNPYGRGIGRSVYYTASYKRFVQQFWATYCEKHATPTIDATMTGNAKRRIDEILEMAENALSRDAVAHDEFVTLKPLESTSGNASVDAYARFISMAEDSEAKAVLGQVLTSSARPSGLGSGAADAQQLVRHDYLEFDAMTLEEWMNYLCRVVVDANLGQRPANGYPRAQVHAEPPTDTGLIADTIKKAQDAGMDVPKAWAYEQLGIPVPKPGEEILEQANPMGSLLPAFGAPGDNPAIGKDGNPVDPNAPAKPVKPPIPLPASA